MKVESRTENTVPFWEASSRFLPQGWRCSPQVFRVFVAADWITSVDGDPNESSHRLSR
jgi:hypothetical protein